ncbi:pentatricopeptide repeat-containing protein, partial [Escherichia coli]|nr:pentatricopeptide repeat-containing protein [Escherichia coli]
ENLDKAFASVNKMENQGLFPDVITYNAILDGFCKQGRMHEAEQVLRRMTEHGVKPDRSTYTSLINGHVSQDNLKAAFRFH